MRYSSLMLLVLAFGLSLCSAKHVDAQGLHDTKVALKVKNTSLKAVYREIERQSHFRFVYSRDAVPEDQEISLSIKSNLASVLDEIERQTHTVHELTGTHIVVTYRPPQQQGRVAGRVVDAGGTPLAGASIHVVETGGRYTSDAEGNFSFGLQPGTYRIEVSYIAYEGQRISDVSVVRGQVTEVLFTLRERLDEIEEVVVVGYGTQRKINLTGAVDQLGGEVFENRPLTSATRGLQGVLPNLNIRMTDGKPTRGAEFNVRGTTSIGAGGSALVLIDGVVGDPALLNPNDIQSVTVLKDAASAAIYGARGSFGVVLITTKSAKPGKTSITLNSNFSLNDRTVKPRMVTNGYQWAESFNEAFVAWNDYQAYPQRVNNLFPFSLDYLDELRRRDMDPSLPKVDVDPVTGNYVYYGNTDWLRELYADYNPSTEHTLAVTGSQDKIDYYLSGRYHYQQGVFRYNPDNFNIYNLRAKLGGNATDWLRIDNNTEFNQRDYRYPIVNNAWNSPVWRTITDATFPMVVLKNPDGSLSEYAAGSVGGFLYDNNASESSTLSIRNTSRFKARVGDTGLDLNGDYTFAYTFDTDGRVFTPVPFRRRPDVEATQGESKLNERNDRNRYTAVNLYLNYDRAMGKHGIGGVIGLNYESTSLRTRFYQRDGIINSAIPDFSLLNGQNYLIEGGGYDWRTMGGFMRLQYAYDSRYLVEMNARYDGSSKFPERQQFGFFPSFSAAWNVARERFWSIPERWVSDWKLRASWGTLGNGNVPPYQYLATMDVQRLPRILNGVAPDYTSAPNVIPNGLTWESATTVNFGTDLSLFRRRLNFVFDWYTRNTADMFTVGTPLPGVFGTDVPRGNYADLRTRGWELTINWKDSRGTGERAFSYSLGAVLADHYSVITRFNNPQGLLNTYYEGMRVGDTWGFVNDGYFGSEAEIAAYPIDYSFIRYSNTNKPLPGDIKFKDLNGDGRIDRGANTLADPGDQTIVGNTEPRYAFGINGSLDHRGVFLTFFFQGIGRQDWWPGREGSLFWGQYNRPYNWMPQDVLDNRWSEENPNAYFPRFRGYLAQNASGSLAMVQSKYMQNAAYIRLKNVSLGYKFSERLTNRLGMSALTMFVTGQNLWTWTPLHRHVKTMDPEVIDGSDPEVNRTSGNGLSYPMLKTYTVGISVGL
ncbi:SusC/RagA family TonB-linked outer membrane protein [Parapedobacter luteus]|nr:TonB-dependent receptor [Parapedobacter luteus]